MTAVLEPATGLPMALSSTAARVDSLVGTREPVDLRTLEERAPLLTRVDRKYVVPVALLEHLVEQLDEGWTALEVGGRRLFGYTSTYFDTADLLTYRAHVQRRRRRFKVRVRRYADSDDCMLEVKRKAFRGLTVKERRPHATEGQDELGREGHAFVLDSLRGHAEPPRTPMSPVVVTSNRRATIACLADRTRLTVDTDLSCGWGPAHTALRPGYVVLESKVGGHGSTVDRLLRSLGERPVPISKYCLGVASLGLDLPTNPWRRTMHRFFDTTTS